MEVAKDEDWMQKKWRPAMGWMYMIICMMDMVVFPILWSLLQATVHGAVNTQWNPLTLQGAGLFHIAMGAVLGISAFGRTQEKLAGTAANPTSTQNINTQNISGNVTGGFGSNQGGMNSGIGGGFGNGPTAGFDRSSSFTMMPSAATPAFSQPFVVTDPVPNFGPTTAPGGRRPVTPGFNV
jgi:hypothetical protein